MPRQPHRHLTAGGGYQVLSEKLFKKLNFDVFFLEYNTARAGGFEPLAAMPGEKMVVLGLISSKVPELEDVGALKARIDEATRYVDLDRLAISPQCGFS